MDVQDPSIQVTVTEVLKSIFIGLGTLAIWLLKKFGDKHIETVEELHEKIDVLNERIAKLSERVAVTEVHTNHHGA